MWKWKKKVEETSCQEGAVLLTMMTEFIGKNTMPFSAVNRAKFKVLRIQNKHSMLSHTYFSQMAGSKRSDC